MRKCPATSLGPHSPQHSYCCKFRFPMNSWGIHIPCGHFRKPRPQIPRNPFSSDHVVYADTQKCELPFMRLLAPKTDRGKKFPFHHPY